MRILFATDHAGFELKEVLLSFVRELGHEVEDKGAHTYDKDDDYPDYVVEVAREISANPDTVKGIVLGGSGQGEAMIANRFTNVRAVVYYGGNIEIVPLSREHNNTNILSLGARFLNESEAQEAVKIWLNTAFSSDARHVRRIEKIDSLK